MKTGHDWYIFVMIPRKKTKKQKAFLLMSYWGRRREFPREEMRGKNEMKKNWRETIGDALPSLLQLHNDVTSCWVSLAHIQTGLLKNYWISENLAGIDTKDGQTIFVPLLLPFPTEVSSPNTIPILLYSRVRSPSILSQVPEKSKLPRAAFR